MVPSDAHVHPGMPLGSRSKGALQDPSSWEARKVFTLEEKVGKVDYVGSTRGQVGKGAKKIGYLSTPRFLLKKPPKFPSEKKIKNPKFTLQNLMLCKISVSWQISSLTLQQ